MLYILDMLFNLIWIMVAVTLGIIAIILDGVQVPHLNIHPSEGVLGATIGIVGSLFGAIVGSVTAYRYNVKLEKERTKERRAIQTKNTIISPIYKQLLGLNNYLEERKSAQDHPVISVYFEDQPSSYYAYTFNIWESMKKDIRKRYIPKLKREQLEHMTNVIKSHINLQNDIDNDDTSIAYEFYDNHKSSIINSGQWNHHMLAGTLRYNVRANGNDIMIAANEIEQQLRVGFSFSEAEYKRYAKQLAKQVMSKNDDYYEKLEPSLDNVIAVVDQVTMSFEEMVDNVIEKYEGGIDVR